MKDKVIEQWDHAAEKYLQAQENSDFVHINKQVVCDRFKDLANKKVLDLGCGYGWYSDYFSSVGADVTGCDGSEKMIAIARSLYPSGKYEVVNVEKRLPYLDSAYDMVFCNQVFKGGAVLRILLVEDERLLSDILAEVRPAARVKSHPPHRRYPHDISMIKQYCGSKKSLAFTARDFLLCDVRGLLDRNSAGCESE